MNVQLSYAEYQWMNEDRHVGDWTYENDDYHDVFMAVWWECLVTMDGTRG